MAHLLITLIKEKRYTVLIVFTAIFTYLISAHSYTLDLEFRSPEIESMERQAQDKQDREAFDRVQKDRDNDKEPQKRDVERAERYVKEHSA